MNQTLKRHLQVHAYTKWLMSFLVWRVIQILNVKLMNSQNLSNIKLKKDCEMM